LSTLVGYDIQQAGVRFLSYRLIDIHVKAAAAAAWVIYSASSAVCQIINIIIASVCMQIYDVTSTETITVRCVSIALYNGVDVSTTTDGNFTKF